VGALITGVATVLLVRDVARALEYYRDKLGFETSAWDLNPPHYGFAERDRCRLHFACFDGATPRPNHQEAPPDMFDVYVEVDDVEALHAELVERGADLLHGPVDQVYGLREVRVRDPSGYILAFGTPIRRE
jgi:catechol 2,3-dioxygenase-like lactoylglutathione lyase family enzyme